MSYTVKMFCTLFITDSYVKKCSRITKYFCTISSTDSHVKEKVMIFNLCLYRLKSLSEVLVESYLLNFYKK